MRSILKLGVALALVVMAESVQAKVIDEHIYLVPAGDVDMDIITSLKTDLPKSLPIAVRIEVSPRERIIESSYDPKKGYSAEAILRDISKRTYLKTINESAIIIVGVDLYSKESGAVFGISDPAKASGIISSVRLKNEFYGQKPDNDLLRQRVLKMALGELGTAFGLANCPDTKCVMYRSDSLSSLDGMKRSFCHDCKRKLYKRFSNPMFNDVQMTFIK